MIYQFRSRKLTQVKNKTYNFQQQKNVILAKEMDLNQVIIPIDVLIVEGMEKFDQIKDFSLYNKLALSVQVAARK